MVQNENELMHFGVLGQKWGVRRYQNKDGSLTASGKQRYRAENYSEKQRIRDRKLYGKHAEKRINKRMAEGGEGVQSARHDEVVRKQRLAAAKRTAVKAVKLAAPIAIAAIMASGHGPTGQRGPKVPPKKDPQVMWAYGAKGKMYPFMAAETAKSTVSGFKNMTMDDLRKLDLY